MADATTSEHKPFMKEISVIIIARNESHIIGRTIKALESLTDDIIIVDSGSSDNTIEIAEGYGARVIRTEWLGFGQTKNQGTEAAKYNWILSLDADEVMSEELKAALLLEDFVEENQVYEIRFRTYFGEKRLRYGEWGRDERHIRLFNRKFAKWNNAEVHEELEFSEGSKKKVLDGYIMHYTVLDFSDYSRKTVEYAMLNAEKYFKAGKRAGWLTLRLSAAFSFIWNYIFRLGFLDGHEGYLTARMTSIYTFMKYAKLRELERNVRKKA